jgi:hypothetical protein
MNAEFNWWLLIVGIVAGAGLAWLVLAEAARLERDVDDRELPAEAAWIAGHLAEQGVDVSDAQAEAVLRAHRTYLGFPPPDALVDPGELRPIRNPTDEGPRAGADARPGATSDAAGPGPATDAGSRPPAEPAGPGEPANDTGRRS